MYVDAARALFFNSGPAGQPAPSPPLASPAPSPQAGTASPPCLFVAFRQSHASPTWHVLIFSTGSEPPKFRRLAEGRSPAATGGRRSRPTWFGWGGGRWVCKRSRIYQFNRFPVFRNLWRRQGNTMPLNLINFKNQLSSCSSWCRL